MDRQRETDKNDRYTDTGRQIQIDRKKQVNISIDEYIDRQVDR